MICSVSGPKTFARKYREFSHRWIDRERDKREDELQLRSNFNGLYVHAVRKKEKVSLINDKLKSENTLCRRTRHVIS